MKYQQWLNEWLKNYVKTTVKQKTYIRYSEAVTVHITPALGEYELDELTPLNLQCFIADLSESGNIKTSKGLSANSVNGIISVIQSSLRVAYHIGLTKEYIADKIKRPKVVEKQIDCFSLDEQKRIEQAVLNSDDSHMFGVIICLYTGLRIGELLSLEWKDIDFENGLLTVNKTCHYCKDNAGQYGRIIDTPKTESSKRIIPIPKQIIPVIKAHKKKSDSPLVISRKGNVISIRTYQRNFEVLLKELGIAHRGFHALRHTFATRAIESGMDVKSLSEILGHQSPMITLKRYAHSLLKHKKEMMNNVGKIFS